MKEKTDYPLVLKVSHVSEILGLTPHAVYELIKRPGFPVMMISGSKGAKRIPRDLFFSWLDDQAKISKEA